MDSRCFSSKFTFRLRETDYPADVIDDIGGRSKHYSKDVMVDRRMAGKTAPDAFNDLQLMQKKGLFLATNFVHIWCRLGRTTCHINLHPQHYPIFAFSI